MAAQPMRVGSTITTVSPMGPRVMTEAITRVRMYPPAERSTPEPHVVTHHATAEAQAARQGEVLL
jgi:hypothetical protein